MRIEKLFFDGKEIEVPVVEENDIEKNENFDLEKTIDLKEVIEKIGEESE